MRSGSKATLCALARGRSVMNLGLAKPGAPGPSPRERVVRLRALVTWAACCELAAAVALFVKFGQDSKSDLAVFLRAGGQVWSGIDPYQPIGSQSLLDGHAFVYPWLAAWLFTPLSWLPNWLGMNSFTMLSVLGVLIAARWLRVPPGLGVAALLLCAPMARNIELGAVNAVFFFLLAAMWRWRDHTWVVAASVTLLVGIKLFLAPVILWVLLTRSRRCAAWTVGSVAAFFGVSFAAGPVSVTEYLQMLRRLSDFMGQQGMGLETSLHHFFPTSPARALTLGLVAIAVVCAVSLTVFKRPGNEAGLLGALVLISLEASPMLWRHYLLLVLFVVALLWPTARALMTAAAISWMVVGSEAIPPLWLNYDQRVVSLHALLFGLFAACIWRPALVSSPALVAPDIEAEVQRSG